MRLSLLALPLLLATPAPAEVVRTSDSAFATQHKLTIAAPVDGVLGGQWTRLKAATER